MHVSSAFGQGLLPLRNSKPHPGCRQHRAAEAGCQQLHSRPVGVECRGHLSDNLPGTLIAAYLVHLKGLFGVGTAGSLCKLQGSLNLPLALPSLSGCTSSICMPPLLKHCGRH